MSLAFSGNLKGHSGWVTSLVCPQAGDSATKVVSASRDKTLVSWRAAENRTSVEDDYGVPEKRLEGHADFVSDVAISNTGDYAVSASWDRALRLWNLKTGESIVKFQGHTKDVLTVAFSPCNRQIVSGGRDGALIMWNVKGERMGKADAHKDWVSCVRFSPATSNPVIVSGSWDNTVKVWDSNLSLIHTLSGHTAPVNTVTISPDGSLCASAGKDGKAKLWDLTKGEHLYELSCDEPINQICFSPLRYWLCAATESSVRVYDLEDKTLVATLTPEVPKNVKSKPQCVTIAWSADGSVLYSGYTDNVVRVWTVRDE